jgi:tRNA (guanine37-N1)-methyltransferase
MSPQGTPLDATLVQSLASEEALILVAGRYEGIDERFMARHVDLEVSVGDYVVSGGELPAMILIDTLVRWLPGALGHEASAAEDSFSEGLLDCPHYTRPEIYEGLTVPAVLLSGHHGEIAGWRRAQSLRRTLDRRPDLITMEGLSEVDRALLDKWDLLQE